MKMLLPILLLLASCGSKTADEEAGEAKGGGGGADTGALAPRGEDLAALQAKVSQAIAIALPDGSTAEYRNLRPGAGGAGCGEVATKGKSAPAGVFRPFIVTPDGLAVVGSGPAIAWDDPGDFVADAWIRWCATPEELERLRPQLQSAAVNSAAAAAAAEIPADEPDLPLPPVREVPVAAPAAEPVPPPRRQDAPPPRIDSFFNSVERGQ